MTKDTQPIMFRKIIKSEDFNDIIVAIFPDIQESGCDDVVMCYQHVGQHSGACWDWVIGSTCRATPAEYKDLLSELVNRVGYDNLRIVQRRSSKMREKGYKDVRSLY